MTQQIAIIRQKYNAAGGAERFVSRALATLLQSGAQVCLITRRWQAIDGLCVLNVNPFYIGNVWRDYGFACAVKKLIRHKSFALVQTHERIPGCDIFRAGDGVHRVWLTNRARALSRWGRLRQWLNPYHHYICHMEKALFHDPGLKAVICNSRMVQKEISTLFGLAQSKLPVIYNGVNTSVFHPQVKIHRQTIRTQYGIPDTAPVLLYVGSGFARKGVARILAALSVYQEVHVLIVGSDKHLSKYQTQAQTLGMAARCHFTGPQQDVLPFYGAADAFILPTLYDPFPNACLEAFACGLPVLTSLQCGAAELITQGENGWACDALDQAGLQQNIGQWLASRANWPDLQTMARQTAEPMTLEHMTTCLVTLYQTLLADKER